MNIDKIIKECPRAWEECMKYFIHPHNYEALEFKYIWNPNTNRIEIWEGDYLDLEIHPRDLYDFFDSVEIKIEVSDKSYESYWVYDVDDYNDNKEYFYEGLDSRTEAEYRAFEKAFEIYEKQLGDKG